MRIELDTISRMTRDAVLGFLIGLVIGGAVLYLVDPPQVFPLKSRERMLRDLEKSKIGTSSLQARMDGVFSSSKRLFEEEVKKRGGSSNLRLTPNFWDDFERANQPVFESLRQEFEAAFSSQYEDHSNAELWQTYKCAFTSASYKLQMKRLKEMPIVTRSNNEAAQKLKNLEMDFFMSRRPIGPTPPPAAIPAPNSVRSAGHK